MIEFLIVFNWIPAYKINTDYKTGVFCVFIMNIFILFVYSGVIIINIINFSWINKTHFINIKQISPRCCFNILKNTIIEKFIDCWPIYATFSLMHGTDKTGTITIFICPKTVFLLAPSTDEIKLSVNKLSD